MDSIGIIGGADGPTKIIVASPLHWYAVAGIALAVIAVAAIIIVAVIRHKRRR